MAPENQSEAVKNYNHALKQVYLAKNLDTDVVLVTSVLFTCIEFLRGNINAAIDHCRHGTRIINRFGGMAEILCLFRHLSIFPHFFGATIADFPSLPEPQHPSSDEFSSLAEAQETMDWLMSRCVRLVRAFDPYRNDILGGSEVPRHLLSLQLALCQELSAWMTAFGRLKSALKLDENAKSLARLLEARWQVCQVWVEITSCQDETVCDAYKDKFIRIIELAQDEVVSRNLAEAPQPPKTFSFEMGMAPLLHFVVIKCRYLQLRLQALSQLKLLAKSRESIWDSEIMYAQGVCFVEFEHGIQLASPLPERVSKEYDCPSESQRIRDSLLDERRCEGIDRHGNPVTFKGIRLFVRPTTEVSIREIQDWIIIRNEEKDETGAA